MQIKAIHIKNFLSFEAFTWQQIDPHLNMIVGPNGVGKTNLFHALKAVKDALNTIQDKNPSNWSSLTHRDLNTPIIEIALDIEFTSEWEQSILCTCVAAAFCNESFLRDNHPNQLIPSDVTSFSEFLLNKVRPERLAWFFSGQLIVSYDGLQWTCCYEGNKSQFHLQVLGLGNTSILEGVAWNEFTQSLFQRQQKEASYFPTVQDVLQKFANETRGILLKIERPNTFVLPTHRIFEQLTGMTLQNNRFYTAAYPFQLLLDHALVFTDNIRRKTLYPTSESSLTTSNIDLRTLTEIKVPATVVEWNNSNPHERPLS